MRNDCFVLPDHAQCRMASLPFPQVLLCILYHLSEQLPAGYLQSSCNQTAAGYPQSPQNSATSTGRRHSRNCSLVSPPQLTYNEAGPNLHR